MPVIAPTGCRRARRRRPTQPVPGHPGSAGRRSDAASANVVGPRSPRRSSSLGRTAGRIRQSERHQRCGGRGRSRSRAPPPTARVNIEINLTGMTDADRVEMLQASVWAADEAIEAAEALADRVREQILS